MTIDFFSTHLSGGAGNAASQIFNNLPSNFKRNFYYQFGEIEDSNYIKRDINQSHNLKQRVCNSLNARLFHYNQKKFYQSYASNVEGFNFIKNFRSTPYSYFGGLPDIINLHWIANWIDYPSFFKSIPNDIPIVWYLHDMNPFTAGCHYSYNCELYNQSCYPCHLVGNKYKSKVKKNFALKSSLLKDKNLHIVGNSQWSTEQAQKSQVYEHAKSFNTIYLGIDTDIFSPYLNISSKPHTDKIKILFGSDNNKTKRKGFNYLIEALHYVSTKHTDFELHTFGNCNLLRNNLNFKIVNHGRISNNNKLAELYSSADIFVVPSLYESFGLTSIEAQSCETPVVGFNTSGLKENIINNETGLLADFCNSIDLGNKILWLIYNSKERIRMGVNARKHIIKNYAIKTQIKKHNDYFNTLINF